MSLSVKDLFHRQDIPGEVISLRNSLANHPDGIKIGLRAVYQQLLTPVDGNGFACGCHEPGSVKISYLVSSRDVGGVLPQWVPAAGTTSLVIEQQNGSIVRSFHDDFSGETRTIEGILANSYIAREDFPFMTWHSYYDWTFHVRFDKQYTYLISPANDPGEMECEWDTAFVPSWAWPQDGDRVWIVGRWIYDCGHPENNLHRSELHPIKAVASFRSQATDFEGNSGPTRANHAILFIGRDGGSWRQPINDRDYAFDLYLPPKPYAEAAPRFKVLPQTGPLPVQPQITPFPSNDPKAFRVVIPLKGVEPHPENYGVIISAGWSDPRGSEATAIKRYRVTVEEILMDANLDPTGTDEWYVYVGINGQWQVWRNLGGASYPLNYSVDLSLHPSDQIHISACGFEADEVDNLMGKNIGLSWADVSDETIMKDNAGKIRDGFLSLGLSLDPGIENDPISIFSQFHPPQALDTVTMASSENDYRLRYRIEEI